MNKAIKEITDLFIYDKISSNETEEFNKSDIVKEVYLSKGYDTNKSNEIYQANQTSKIIYF